MQKKSISNALANALFIIGLFTILGGLAAVYLLGLLGPIIGLVFGVICLWLSAAAGNDSERTAKELDEVKKRLAFLEQKNTPSLRENEQDSNPSTA